MKTSILNILARNTVGDDCKPNLYFVSDGPDTVLVTTESDVAYDYWSRLAQRYPLQESTLEDRSYGVICSVQKDDLDPDGPLIIIDDFERA